MALKLMEFDVMILYREGSKNANADALSRQSWPEEERDSEDTNDPENTASENKEERKKISMVAPRDELSFASASSEQGGM